MLAERKTPPQSFTFWQHFLERPEQDEWLHFSARLKLLCLFHTNETLRKWQPLWAEMHLSSSTHPQQILPFRRWRVCTQAQTPSTSLWVPLANFPNQWSRFHRVSTFDPENTHFFAPLWLWTWHWRFHYLLIANHSVALFWPVSSEDCRHLHRRIF